MDALTYLNETVKIEDILEYYGFEGLHEDGNMIRGCCKIHDGDNKTAFVANRENNLWYCHTGGCGGGDAIALVQQLEKCDFVTAVKRVAEICNVDINNYKIVEHQQSHIKEVKKFIALMKSKKKKQTLKEYQFAGEFKEIQKFREFHIDTINHYGMVYIDNVSLKNKAGNEYTLRNRLLIPIIQNGIQVGGSIRRIKSEDNPKWLHQPAEIETSNILYNYDIAKHDDVIVICEGIFDVWAFYEAGVHAVCTFGAHISQEQYKLLMRTGAELVLAFDGDKAGATATQKAIEMFKNKATLYVLPFDEGQDPENIDRHLLRHKFDNELRRV